MCADEEGQFESLLQRGLVSVGIFHMVICESLLQRGLVGVGVFHGVLMSLSSNYSVDSIVKTLR